MRQALVTLLLIATAVTARADVFRVLEDDRDAMQARIDIIQQAHNEIDALYFLARNDRITLCALSLLRDARRRGVSKVRLVVDANFQHIPKPVLAHLSDEGVQVRVYHPLTLRHPSWIFRRMHEKVVLVDGARYITGGRNLAESYFGMSRRNYIDRDVYVEGASGAVVDRHFEEMWNCPDVVALHAEVSDEEKRKASLLLDAAPAKLALNGFVDLGTGRDWSAGQKDVGPVRFLHDPLVDDAGPRVGVQLAQIIDAAKHSVVIESPYLIPSRSMLDLLEAKRAAGVRVQIVTNSLRASDGALAYAGYLKYKRRMVRAGIDIREFKGPDTLHSKSLVIDGRVVVVGSYNIDPRSQNLNTEAMCVAEDDGTADELLRLIGVHINNAWLANQRARGLRAPLSWRVRAWISRWLLPIVETQL